jgi:hypothetical protein
MPGTVSSPETLLAVFDDLQAESPNITLADDATLDTEAKSQAGVIEWRAASSSLIPEIAKLLDVPLPGLLVGFWQKADEVVAALERSKHSPEEATKVSFIDSKTEASFNPYIEVRLNGVATGKEIPFTVALPLTFTRVVLIIKNGEIVDVAAGECTIEGCIKLGSVTVAQLRTPVTVTLAPGLLGRRTHSDS